MSTTSPIFAGFRKRPWRIGTPWRPRPIFENLLWVVLRHEIDYKQAAFLGDGIIARTWVGSSTHATFERFTELLRAGGRSVLAKARTVWRPIDAQTRRPTGVSAAVQARFSHPASTAETAAL